MVISLGGWIVAGRNDEIRTTSYATTLRIGPIDVRATTSIRGILSDDVVNVPRRKRCDVESNGIVNF